MIEFLLVAGYSSIFLLFINKLAFFQTEGIPKHWISIAFIVKVLTGFLLYLIYTLYYTDRNTADIFKYFDDSKIMYNSLFSKPIDFLSMISGIGNDQPKFNQYYFKMNNWCGIYPSNIYGDGHLMIRFNAILRLISFGYYNVHAVFTSFLAFTGLIGLFKIISKTIVEKKFLLFLLVFFFPSILFWSSGVLKEGLIFFSIGMILYLIDKMSVTKLSYLQILILLFSTLLLRYTKFYLFILLLPLGITYCWNIIKPGKYLLIRYLGVYIAFITGAIIVGKFFPVYDPVYVIARKQHDFLQLAISQHAGSLIHVRPMNNSFLGLLSGIVPGFIRALLMPFPWDIRNIMMIMPLIENFILIFILIFAIYSRKKPNDFSIFYFSLIFFLLIFALAGMMTPVIGAMVRYRCIGIPFFFSALFQITNFEGLKKAPTFK